MAGSNKKKSGEKKSGWERGKLLYISQPSTRDSLANDDKVLWRLGATVDWFERCEIGVIKGFIYEKYTLHALTLQPDFGISACGDALMPIPITPGKIQS